MEFETLTNTQMSKKSLKNGLSKKVFYSVGVNTSKSSLLFLTFLLSFQFIYCRMAAEIATYEEVKDLPNHPEKLLIDVREPKEIAETGQIPTSINIPLAEVEAALSMDPSDFKSKYGRELKSKDEQELIFHCKLGGRAAKGADKALQLGYKNVKNYKGSWTEWSQKEGL